MAQATWNGIDGVDERTRAPYRAVHSRAHRAGISCRKTHLAFVMDMHDVPWSWDTPEAVLEARLRESDGEAYRQFLRDREEA